MKFGVREICNVVFRAQTAQKIGETEFKAKQPVLYIDTATASNLEQAATTVYAQGGRGNARLIAWDGEKTLTFTVTDALMSPVGLSILSGAGLFKDAYDKGENIHVHTTTDVVVGSDGTIDLTNALGTDDEICEDAPIFVMGIAEDGSLNGDMAKGALSIEDGVITLAETDNSLKNKSVKVDYYVLKAKGKVSELVIDAGHFAGNYYVEADTLFRDQATGKDMPAVITLPNVKIQSNFTFSMASTGDPSTFDFTMDAMPGYTYFDKTLKTMCVIQVINELDENKDDRHSVMYHED